MTKSQAPDAPITLVLIHRTISRGLQVGLSHTQSFAREGYPDPATGEGFGLYLRTLAGVLHIHHSAEDKVAFPFLRETSPDLPLDDLIEEHVQMASILEEIAPVADQLHGQAGEGPALEATHGALTRLAEIWPSHIDVEESSISVKQVQAVVGAEALARWLQEMGQHRPEGAPPDPVALPFILHNLSAEDRAIMAQFMPPIVSQELVPKAWKENWAPMKPFLLD
jgi:hemerythrin-like domain-containing protein